MHCSRNSVLTPFLHCTARARVCGWATKTVLFDVILWWTKRAPFEIWFSFLVLVKNIRNNGLCFCFLYQRTDCSNVEEVLGISFYLSYDRRDKVHHLFCIILLTITLIGYMLSDFVHMGFFHSSYTRQVHSHVFCCQLKDLQQFLQWLIHFCIHRLCVMV